MSNLDCNIEFVPIRIAVLTISDSRTLATDKSGSTLSDLINKSGHVLVKRNLIKDDVQLIVEKLNYWILDSQIDIVITSGGTGVTGRDVTPEAFRQVIEKEIPGFGELFRWLSYATIGTSTIQSRAMAGVANGTYLFALPGSTGAVKDAWDGILKHQLDVRHQPCNFIELIPRLSEK